MTPLFTIETMAEKQQVISRYDHFEVFRFWWEEVKKMDPFRREQLVRGGQGDMNFTFNNHEHWDPVDAAELKDVLTTEIEMMGADINTDFDPATMSDEEISTLISEIMEVDPEAAWECHLSSSFEFERTRYWVLEHEG